MKNIDLTHEKTAPFRGLNAAEVEASRRAHGPNRLYLRPKRHLGHLLLEVVREPMFLLLALACALYFLIGDNTEAWLMFAAVLFVIVIEIVQEFRSEKALEALRQFAQPRVRVIREGREQTIASDDVVVGDLLAFAEGERLSADGVLLHAHDLSIDEAVLTGESLPADKVLNEPVYQGTVAASGHGVAAVTAVGLQTEFGKLGKAIESIESEPTPLQRQIDRFVRQMVLAGMLAFLLVFGVNVAYTDSLLAALLFSLAFAMALVPEEIPVAFTTFMAIGAYRMTRQKILVKQPKTVESLGSATVICLDKTGTITENRMTVDEVIDFSGKNRVLEYAMWSSEPDPFDVMEKAIHQAYSERTERDLRPDFQMVHEYPLGGTPPMMTHLYENAGGQRIVAGKGAVERILRICDLPEADRETILDRVHELAARGYRVLGVASAEHSGETYPAKQDDFPWQFEGLVALYDPPKRNIRRVMEKFYQAGIQVKMITGDHPATAMNIADECGIRHNRSPLTGRAVMEMSEDELRATVVETDIFARMFPEAKLRVVEALKAGGQVVAMTGDGVNDGPALKAAQIGVAMGHRGTEVAKSAASMVLLDDDLGHMVTAVQMGRRIYANLHKAIRYVISIHIPIVLTVALPLVLGWEYIHILTPIHVIFLELIMDPTCAVAFENEPTEPHLMRQGPRRGTSSLFAWNELAISIVQGLAITAGILAMYQYAVRHGADEPTTRAFVFTTMLAANIFLTLVNRSFEYTIVKTIFYPNRLLWYILGASTALLVSILFVPWLRELFKMSALSPPEIAICLGVALLSVGWFELVKRWLGKNSVTK